MELSYAGSIVEKIAQCLNLNFIVACLVIDPCICEEKCISSFLSLFLSRPTKGGLILPLPFFLFPAPPLKIDLFHFIIIFLSSPALVHSVTRVTFHFCQHPCRFLCPRQQFPSETPDDLRRLDKDDQFCEKKVGGVWALFAWESSL